MPAPADSVSIMHLHSRKFGRHVRVGVAATKWPAAVVAVHLYPQCTVGNTMCALKSTCVLCGPALAAGQAIMAVVGLFKTYAGCAM